MDKKIFVASMMIITSILWVIGVIIMASFMINNGGTLGFITAPILVLIFIGCFYKIMGKVCKYFFGKKQ